jgi:hypothetical protein
MLCRAQIRHTQLCLTLRQARVSLPNERWYTLC